MKKHIRIIIVLFLVWLTAVVALLQKYGDRIYWKLDEWRRKETIELVHNNFFEHGIEGMLSDLDKELNLPKELFISGQYQMTFDMHGEIQTIHTFFYGQDENGQTRSYLVAYDCRQSKDMIVWKDEAVNASYEEKNRFAPMILILKNANCRYVVNDWVHLYGEETYEILYYGHRSFDSPAGLRYLPGDVNGDGMEKGKEAIAKLQNGGEVAGFEVSLHIPDNQEETPIRYIIEPEYSSPESLQIEQETKQAEESIKADSWTVDRNDGTMYFFLEHKVGWRLVVTDAAAGSRFYVLERTQDGGSTWIRTNENPFEGNIGVTEGLLFFDKNFGFAGLTGASQDYSRMFMTTDGGDTFTQIMLPMEAVTKLPETAEAYGQTLEDFDYLCMPQFEDGILTIQVLSAAMETDGIVFQSKDMGITWEFAGTKP